MNSNSADIYQRFRRFNASTVFEAAGKMGDLPFEIRALDVGMTVCGRALTIKCFPGDTSALVKGINAASPGDVLVIDSGSGSLGVAWGGGTTIAAMRLGVVGVVTNGSVRDIKIIRSNKFPVFCTGASVRSSIRKSAGSVGEQIAFGSTVISTGDLVLGDEDGVVVASGNRLDEIFEASLVRQKYEDEHDEALRNGTIYGQFVKAK